MSYFLVSQSFSNNSPTLLNSSYDTFNSTYSIPTKSFSITVILKDGTSNFASIVFFFLWNLTLNEYIPIFFHIKYVETTVCQYSLNKEIAIYFLLFFLNKISRKNINLSSRFFLSRSQFGEELILREKKLMKNQIKLPKDRVRTIKTDHLAEILTFFSQLDFNDSIF